MKKAVFINPNFYHLLQSSTKNSQIVDKIIVSERNTLLLPYCIGSTIIVHNGKDYLKVYVSENMIGHKLGEFSASRRRYFFKKGKVKQKTKK